ncbi:hypothetical protein ArsFIN_47320 (plasmid) [Arsenophonus nasoniae]|uniref:Uncharacterized protein n=1 Tax=Arsenophonus nasoniae TaxID=638 RepID=A0A4P7L0S1_9GAMM|nr:hypothetical protein ArsFIN_47320 [Arsenophonus nasoniae]
MSLFRLGEINERYYRENIEMFYLIVKKRQISNIRRLEVEEILGIYFRLQI